MKEEGKTEKFWEQAEAEGKEEMLHVGLCSSPYCT